MKYNPDRCTVELSVRALCENAFRDGDLGGFAPYDYRAMADGARIHRRLQGEAGAYYSPEVALSCTVLSEGIYYTVSGRADGVFRAKDGITVDEIKCVRGGLFYEPPREMFLAQMKCYAYFLALRDELQRVNGRITYYNVDTKKIKYFKYSYTADELREYFLSLLSRIKRKAELCIERVTERLPSAAGVRFPYKELREGQEQIIRESYSCIRKGKRLFVEAPTGTGKTMSVLYPAVKALGEGRADKIFYLTAKASVRREAYKAASELFAAGAKLRTVVITAKEQVCACGKRLLPKSSAGSLCNPIDCANAAGYYSSVDKAIDEILSRGNGYPRKLICEVAQKYGICPYELSLDLSELCDIIICDYNYAFDPSVYMRRYFSENERGEDYVFLVDEAHNLADRARDMYSASLGKKLFESAAERIDPLDSEPVGMCDSAVRAFLPIRALCSDNLVRDALGEERGYFSARSPLGEFNKEMELFKKRSDAWLRKNREGETAVILSDLNRAVRKFLTVNEFFDKGFLSYAEVLGGDITVKTCCLDPSPIMNSLLGRARAAVLFSATLTPTDYFCSMLGGAKRAKTLSVVSPFDSEKLCVAVADYVSTRYGERDKNAVRFANIIAAAVSAKYGNYIAYFPSYSCLESVLQVFRRKYPKVETVVQERNMSAKDRETFLAAFKNDEGCLRVGFCVLGGVFSEGVDLPGSCLIGAVIFGVGLPGISNERNMIRDYVDPDGAEGCGYDYAYTYPGMNNVLQAAGRVIRRDDDKGIIVLADDRYASPKYREMFPKHWKAVKYAGNAKSLAEIMHRFWDKEE